MAGMTQKELKKSYFHCGPITEDNVKLLKQLESGFKRIINCNKHQSELTKLPQNSYLNYLIDSSFHGVNNGLFLLLLENEIDRGGDTKYYIPNVEIKDYNVIFDGRDFFDQPIKKDLTTYERFEDLLTYEDLIR